MMRAAQFRRFGGPEVLEIVERAEPHAGPGQVRIAVRAAGVQPGDLARRRGELDRTLPQTLGHEAAGVVDEIGPGVTGVGLGDEVFGFSPEAACQAERAVLSFYAPIPPSLDFAGAAALPAAVETATRVLRQLGVRPGHTLLVHGASGNVGSAVVQLAVADGVRVIGTAGPANHDHLRTLGALPVTYGEGLVGRVRATADRVDRALDVAGRGDLADLVELAGGADRVLTVSDQAGAVRHGVRFSPSDTDRALDALTTVAGPIASGRFALPVARSFPLTDIAAAHRVAEGGQVRGKLVLLID